MPAAAATEPPGAMNPQRKAIIMLPSNALNAKGQRARNRAGCPIGTVRRAASPRTVSAVAECTRIASPALKLLSFLVRPMNGLSCGVTRQVLDSYADALNSPDDSPVVWLALAFSQSKTGRLDPAVAARALQASSLAREVSGVIAVRPRRAPE